MDENRYLNMRWLIKLERRSLVLRRNSDILPQNRRRPWSAHSVQWEGIAFISFSFLCSDALRTLEIMPEITGSSSGGGGGSILGSTIVQVR